MCFRYQHRVGCPNANKAKRSWGWQEVRKTQRKCSSQETNGKYVCALNQRFRQQETAWSQTIVSGPSSFFSFFFFCFWTGNPSLTLLFCLSAIESSMLFQPLNTLLHLSLSGMLEQHWGSYICRHAWALCCRSPKPAVNRGAWSGSYVDLAKLKPKYTLSQSKWLYLKPNQPWSHELIIHKTHACLRAMPWGYTRRA